MGVSIAAITVVLTVVIGTIVGVISGRKGGFVDDLL
ncbi:ABC transporter permease, partial [Amaricoccus sp. HAR-UPW-R2A-40]